MFGAFGINAVLISFTYVLVFVLRKPSASHLRLRLSSCPTSTIPSCANSPGMPRHIPAFHAGKQSRIGSRPPYRCQRALVRTGRYIMISERLIIRILYREPAWRQSPDALSPLQSARIVIGHVTDGLKRADKAKLPQVVRNFISQHHGRGKAKYFYTTYTNSHPGEG